MKRTDNIFQGGGNLFGKACLRASSVVWESPLKRLCARWRSIRTGLTVAAASAFMVVVGFGADEKPWGSEVASNGRKVRVTNAAELVAAFDNLKDGDTILLADGVYEPGRRLQIDGVKNISIHGESRNPDQVVWLGNGWANRGKSNDRTISSFPVRTRALKSLGSGISRFTITPSIVTVSPSGPDGGRTVAFG